jgi:hypothetical protein
MPVNYYRLEVHPPQGLKKKLELLRREMEEKTGKRVTMNELVVSILAQFVEKNVLEEE